MKNNVNKPLICQKKIVRNFRDILKRFKCWTEGVQLNW